MGNCVGKPPSRPGYPPVNPPQQPKMQIQSGQSQISIGQNYMDNDNDIIQDQNVCILADRNELVMDPYNDQPYRCIGRVVAGHLELRSQNQISLPYGTGFIIHPRIVLTSAHNIYLPGSKKAANQLFFIIESDEEGEQNIIKVDRYAINQNYFDNNSLISRKYDIAILILQQNNKITPDMCLKIEYDSKIDIGNDWKYMISGYPKSKNQHVPRILQWKGTIQINKFNQNLIFFKHITSHGYSGSPIIKKNLGDKTQYVAIGVHKGQVFNGNGIGVLFKSESRQLFQILQNLQQNIIINIKDKAQKTVNLNDYLEILQQQQLQQKNKHIKQYFLMGRIRWSKQLKKKIPLKSFIRPNTNQNSYLNFFNIIQNLLINKIKSGEQMILSLETWRFILDTFRPLILDKQQTQELFKIFLELIQLNQGNKKDVDEIEEVQRISKKLYNFLQPRYHKDIYYMISNQYDYYENLSKSSIKLRIHMEQILKQKINTQKSRKRQKQKKKRQMTFYLNHNLFAKAFQFAEQPLHKGKILLRLKQYENALNCFFKSLQLIYINNGSSKEIADIKFHIARTYHILQNYPKAREIYLQCLQIDEKTHGTLSYQYISTLNNIGQVYQAQKDYDLALKYYQISFQFKKQIYDKISANNIVISLFNIAENYRKLKKYDKALQKYNDALLIANNKNYKQSYQQNKIQSYHIQYCIGLIYKHQKQFNLAFQNLLVCIKQLQNIGDRKAKQGLVKNYWTISVVYKQNNNIKQAKQYMRKTYELSFSLFGDNPLTKRLKGQYEQLQKLWKNRRQQQQ